MRAPGVFGLLLIGLVILVGVFQAEAVLVSPQVHIQGGFSGSGTAFTNYSILLA